MRKLPIALVVAAALTPLGAGTSFAGQPNASCESSGANPPPGFSSGGFTTHAQAVYAGVPGTPSAANGNSHAVSQSDIACFGGPKK